MATSTASSSSLASAQLSSSQKSFFPLRYSADILKGYSTVAPDQHLKETAAAIIAAMDREIQAKQALDRKNKKVQDGLLSPARPLHNNNASSPARSPSSKKSILPSPQRFEAANMTISHHQIILAVNAKQNLNSFSNENIPNGEFSISVPSKTPVKSTPRKALSALGATANSPSKAQKTPTRKPLGAIDINASTLQSPAQQKPKPKALPLPVVGNMTPTTVRPKPALTPTKEALATEVKTCESVLPSLAMASAHSLQAVLDAPPYVPSTCDDASDPFATPRKVKSSATDDSDELFSPENEAISPNSLEVRLAQREKQITYGKNTVGYQNYLQQVPKEKRTRDMPRTPEKRQSCSKRSWDGQIRKWRRQLHEWDPEPQSGLLDFSEC